MKLLPKARPVQISKLRLGGKDINTLEDLRENFYVHDIIMLGRKFTQWLDRNNGLDEYSSQVSSIFSDSKASKEKLAQALVALFFPEYKDYSASDAMQLWAEDEEIPNDIKHNLLKCFAPNVQLANDLMELSLPECLWMEEWLELCAQENIGRATEEFAKFCYLYSFFLKGEDEDESRRWLQVAIEKGSKEAATVVRVEEKRREEEKKQRSPEEIQIGTKAQYITMVKVEDPEHGDFYIAKNVIPCSMFNFFNCGYNYRSSESDSFKRRNICNLLLQELNSSTRYKWRYPKLSQWTKAKDAGNINMPHPVDAEWCEHRGNDMYYVANYHEPLLHYVDMAYLRPVLNVKENPSLR